MTATVHVLHEVDDWRRAISRYNRRVERLHVALGPMRGDYQSLAELASEPRWYGWRGYLQPKWKREVAAHLREHLARHSAIDPQRAIETAYELLPRAWR